MNQEFYAVGDDNVSEAIRNGTLSDEQRLFLRNRKPNYWTNPELTSQRGWILWSDGSVTETTSYEAWREAVRLFPIGQIIAWCDEQTERKLGVNAMELLAQWRKGLFKEDGYFIKDKKLYLDQNVQSQIREKTHGYIS